jgi:hypothetical protein
LTKKNQRHVHDWKSTNRKENSVTKTVWEIKETYGARFGEVVNSWRDQIEDIRAQRTPREEPYLDRLNDEQKRALLLDQKLERASSVTGAARKAYREAVQEYRKELGKRDAEIRPALFHVEDAQALATAAQASDDSLLDLLDHAADAGQTELAKACYLTAWKRGRADVMLEYYDRVDASARELMAEFSEIPPAQVLDRTVENVEAVIPEPSPDSLTPAAVGTT